MTNSQSIQIANIHAAPIAYRDTGDGPAIVLIHGFCGSSEYWKHVIPAFSSSHRVIALDLRGHGQSPVGHEPSTMEALADDVAALLTYLHIDEAIVFGHSLGGYITLALVERHPELVKRFSLIHSTSLPDSDEAKNKRIQGIASIQDKGIQAFVDGLIPKLFAETNLTTMAEQVRAAIEIGHSTSPAGAMSSLEGMRIRPERAHILRNNTIPILLIAGSEDQIIPAERVFSVTGNHIQSVTINGVGHMSMLEAPEQLISAMTSFMMD